jgi:hypothetical protein
MTWSAHLNCWPVVELHIHFCISFNASKSGRDKKMARIHEANRNCFVHSSFMCIFWCMVQLDDVHGGRLARVLECQ